MILAGRYGHKAFQPKSGKFIVSAPQMPHVLSPHPLAGYPIHQPSCAGWVIFLGQLHSPGRSFPSLLPPAASHSGERMGTLPAQPAAREDRQGKPWLLPGLSRQPKRMTELVLRSCWVGEGGERVNSTNKFSCFESKSLCAHLYWQVIFSSSPQHWTQDLFTPIASSRSNSNQVLINCCFQKKITLKT